MNSCILWSRVVASHSRKVFPDSIAHNMNIKLDIKQASPPWRFHFVITFFAPVYYLANTWENHVHAYNKGPKKVKIETVNSVPSPSYHQRDSNQVWALTSCSIKSNWSAKALNWITQCQVVVANLGFFAFICMLFDPLKTLPNMTRGH